jgi:hypothetical protein
MSEPEKKPDSAMIVTLTLREFGQNNEGVDRGLEIDYKTIIPHDRPGIESHTQALRLDAEEARRSRGNNPERLGDGRARFDWNQRTPGPADTCGRGGGGC